MIKINLDNLAPYHRLFSYPDDNTKQQQECCRQLQELGVDYLLAEGTVQLGGLPLLGCGYCGLVLAGCWHGQEVAIKLLRRSCRQADLYQEASLQQRVNQLGIGPALYCHSANILVMERLNSASFGVWLAQLTSSDAPQLQQVLLSLIEQCFTLDQAGIDHGALRCISEHVFVGDKQPTIIDFSHSSAQRHPNNVTSLVSGLLWGTSLAQTIAELIPVPMRDNVQQLLRCYKLHPNRDNLDQLIQTIGLNGVPPVANS